jgi:hypothetical protein
VSMCVQLVPGVSDDPVVETGDTQDSDCSRTRLYLVTRRGECSFEEDCSEVMRRQGEKDDLPPDHGVWA